MNTNTTIAQAPVAAQEAPASSIVRLQGVSKIYGSGDAQVRALDDVSEDIDITALTDAALTKLRRDRIGFVFQSFNLVPTLDARANILLPMRLAGATPEKEWFDLIVTSLGIADRLSHRPSEMSGGQQQRVAVARALMSRPAVIVADEPTGNLDSHSTGEVMDLLRRAVDELGQSVIMVTHDTDTAAYADRVLVCRDGRIVSDLRDVTTDSLTAALR